MSTTNRPGIRFDYTGASVLVTGGTSGIGHGIATAYRDAGAQVTITGTRGAVADYDSDLAGMRYLQLDVTDAAAVDAVAAAVPAVDILVNNAGIALASQGIDEWIPENFELALTMLLTSGFRLATRLRDKLAATRLEGGASVIGIGSMTSFFAVEVTPGYGAAKAAVVQMTKTLALSWAKHNIRANCVAVGLCESRMTQHVVNNPAWAEPTLARTPLGRLGKPSDVAGPVMFLTSPAAAFITGQTLAVDGGFTIAG